MPISQLLNSVRDAGLGFGSPSDAESCSETEIEEFLSTKNLIKITDILGRESTNKGFQLHLYDDGSVEKKYLIK